MTRLVGLIGGMGVIYYLELKLTLLSPLREHFRLYSAVVCFLVHGHGVRGAMEDPHAETSVEGLEQGTEISLNDSKLAGREAATFVTRHHLFEAWWVP